MNFSIDEIHRAVIFGRPNSGKTSIFNAISGQMQKVGNWSGVTVSATEAKVRCSTGEIELVDLPGCHSLISFAQTPKDEKIALDYLWQNSQGTLVINVVNAANLRRDLYLTRQLLEIWRGPMIVVLNCMDLALKKGIKINIDILAKSLGVSVMPMIAKNNQGLASLEKLIISHVEEPNSYNHKELNYPKEISRMISQGALAIGELSHNMNVDGLTVHAMEGDTVTLNESDRSSITGFTEKITKVTGIEFDVYMARYRYDYIDSILVKVCGSKIRKSPLTQNKNISYYLDSVLLNRIIGLPIFFFVMYLMFVFSINLGGAFQDFFDLSSQAIFIQLPKLLLSSVAIPNWLIVFVADGIGQGINVTLSFIPVLFSMFFALSVLEQSGYMVRAAFLVDKFMKYLGLPGQSFIPMIVGFGCNVPAVMGTRTLSNRNERILTIMMMPFMSCSARLAIYTVFVSAFFDSYGHNVIFALYFLGILVALLTGIFLRLTILGKSNSRLILDLPEYQVPKFSQICKNSWLKLKRFISKAGMVIIPVCALLGVMGEDKDNGAFSALERTGRFFTPALEPMGIDKDNWQATVALITGMSAKEVMVGTLSSLYGGNKNKKESLRASDILATLQNSLSSVSNNLKGFSTSLVNPLKASAPDIAVNDSMIGVMHTKFKGAISAFAYLLFILLYFPCISVVASIAKELNKKWAVFSVVWSTFLAYIVSVSFYQVATWSEHPSSSSAWVFGIILTLMGFGFLLKLITSRKYKSKMGAVKFPTQVIVS